MRSPIHFAVHGTPKGQPRPRAFSRGGFTRVYDPGTAEGWKSQIAVAARPFLCEQFVGPVHLKIDFYFPRPKAHSGKHGLKPNAPRLCITKPDADNAAKAVMDALTELKFWHDDAQVAVLSVFKRYASDPSFEGAIIEISELEL